MKWTVLCKSPIDQSMISPLILHFLSHVCSSLALVQADVWTSVEHEHVLLWALIVNVVVLGYCLVTCVQAQVYPAVALWCSSQHYFPYGPCKDALMWGLINKHWTIPCSRHFCAKFDFKPLPFWCSKEHKYVRKKTILATWDDENYNKIKAHQI